MADERRAAERVRLALEARWTGLSGQHTARVYDLSLTGCYIEWLGQVNSGERVVFQIALPDGSWLVLHGVVVHCDPHIGFGLHFLALAPATRRRLEETLAHARAK
ncbi:MAG: PilZ domain-containing protein [Pyrinomonadaceae bacterium]